MSPQPVPPNPCIRASVCAGALDTEYLRAGHGATVVLLAAEPVVDGEVPPLVAALAGGFRVIAPRVAPGAGGGCGWLRDFLDGLGVGDAAVVADEAHAPSLLAFAADEPARLRCVVLLGADADAPCPVPLLLARPAAGASAAEVAAGVSPFLAQHA